MTEFAEPAAIFGVVTIIILAVIALPVVGAIAIDRSLTEANCAKFEHASGFKTKFVDFNFVSYDCLAQRTDGKWVSTSYLRESDDN